MLGSTCIHFLAVTFVTWSVVSVLKNCLFVMFGYSFSFQANRTFENIASLMDFADDWLTYVSPALYEFFENSSTVDYIRVCVHCGFQFSFLFLCFYFAHNCAAL